jgi:hypothetical protein
MDEKKDAFLQPSSESIHTGTVLPSDEFEVFKTGTDGVQFRLVGWVKASVIFLKRNNPPNSPFLLSYTLTSHQVIFATGVLSIPVAMYSLGAIGGSLSVIGWGSLNTYFAIVQGNFRNRHAHCHSIADMAHVVGGPIFREVVGFLFIVAYVLCAGSGIVGLSVGFNALSDHAMCSVWWALVAYVLVVGCASVRKFEKIGWL